MCWRLVRGRCSIHHAEGSADLAPVAARPQMASWFGAFDILSNSAVTITVILEFLRDDIDIFLGTIAILMVACASSGENPRLAKIDRTRLQ